MIEITAEENFKRLDVFLAEELKISRSRASDLIANENVKGNRKLKPSMKVIAGEKFFVQLPVSPNIEELEPENINFDVIYEDEFLLVINKPSGLVVHPAPGNWEHTLVNGLVYRYPEMKFMSQRLRPGIVHRLDAGTSGLMIVARNDEVLLRLQKMFQERTINKQYIALIHGRPNKSEGIISAPLDRDPDNSLRRCAVEGGKPALTGYKVLWTKKNISMVVCKLFTGRTHQIRAHFSGLNCPLVGDVLYGANDKDLTRVFLHSWKIDFVHPVTKEKMKFTQYIGQDFKDFIKRS